MCGWRACWPGTRRPGRGRGADVWTEGLLCALDGSLVSVRFFAGAARAGVAGVPELRDPPPEPGAAPAPSETTWETVAGSGVLAVKSTERGGFEPPEAFRPHLFSRQAP